MIRFLIIIALSLFFTTSIIPGFEKDKTCAEPCNTPKPKASSPKNLQKSNVSPSQEIKKEKINTINIHSSSTELKEIIRKKVQPIYSESHAIDRIKITTREELNKPLDTKLNKKFLPSNQNIDKNLNGFMKKKEQDLNIQEAPFNDTWREY